MSANTLWNVKVGKIHIETIQVSAVTSEEAAEEALTFPGVVFVDSVDWYDSETQEEVSDV